MSKFLYAAPPRRAVNQHLRPANEGDLAVPELIEVLKREPSSGFVIHHYRTDRVARQLPANRCRWNIPFAEGGEQVDVHKKPVGDDDQRLDVAFEEHFKVTLEAAPLIMRVRKERNVRRLIERILDAAQDRRAKRVRDIEKHNADAMASFAAKKPRHGIRPVAELLRRFLDALLCGRCNVPRQRRAVQDDGNRGGWE